MFISFDHHNLHCNLHHNFITTTTFITTNTCKIPYTWFLSRGSNFCFFRKHNQVCKNYVCEVIIVHTVLKTIKALKDICQGQATLCLSYILTADFLCVRILRIAYTYCVRRHLLHIVYFQRLAHHEIHLKSSLKYITCVSRQNT